MNIIDRYIKWIKENSLSNEIKKGVWKISTPFLDRHNDHLEIYAVSKEEDTFKLTDDGYTLSDLRLSGFELNSPKRREIFNITIKRLAVEFNEKTNEIYTITRIEDLGRNKHNLIQAMVTINDMFCLSQPTISTIFKEDVKEYFRKTKVRFIEDIRIMGKSGYEHNIDFAIPSDYQEPEKLIKTINHLNKESFKNLVFLFVDIQENRTGIKKIVIFNDEINYTKSSLGALKNYDIEAIPWSKKEIISKNFL